MDLSDIPILILTAGSVVLYLYWLSDKEWEMTRGQQAYWEKTIDLRDEAAKDYINSVREADMYHNWLLECWHPPLKHYYYTYIDNKYGVLLMLILSYIIMLVLISKLTRAPNYKRLINKFKKEVENAPNWHTLSEDFTNVHNDLAKKFEILLKTPFETFTDISQFKEIRIAFSDYQKFADTYKHFLFIPKMNYMDELFIDICLTNKYINEK